MEVTRTSSRIIMAQKKFTKELLFSSYYLDLSHHTFTHLPSHSKLSAYEGDPISDPAIYRCLVGKLNFLPHTRSYPSFTVQALNQFMHDPRSSHMNVFIILWSMLLALLVNVFDYMPVLIWSCKLSLTQIGDLSWLKKVYLRLFTSSWQFSNFLEVQETSQCV